MTLERVVAARWIKLEKKKERKLYIVCDKKNNFFQVRTAGSGVRGWLDASHETNNWLKYVRSTSSPHAVNMRHVLIGGQVMFEKERKKKKKNCRLSSANAVIVINSNREFLPISISELSIIVLQVGV